MPSFFSGWLDVKRRGYIIIIMPSKWCGKSLFRHYLPRVWKELGGECERGAVYRAEPTEREDMECGLTAHG